MNKIQKLLGLSLILMAITLLFGMGKAHAATLTVSGSCTINDAIDSVNAGSDQASCGGTGYGTNDTINIPAGTHTLPSDPSQITNTVVIKGAGMNQTIIDGDIGQYQGFTVATAGQVTFEDMTITAYKRAAISTAATSIILNNIEVDGNDSTPNGSNMFGLYIQNDDAGTFTFASNNVYIHDLHGTGNPSINAFVVDQKSGGTTNATIQNTTVTDITGDSNVNGIALSTGLWNGTGGTGTLNTTITNTTVTDLSSTGGIVGPFSSLAFSIGGTATVTTQVYNVTITGTRGITYTQVPLVGVMSGAFYAATAGLGNGSQANVSVTVGNSLLADNLSDTTSNNCTATDLTSNFGGSGSGTATITSLGHNLSDDASCPQFAQPGDQQNVGNIISTLGPLQNNGGLVPTRALLPGSPAIGAGGQVLGVSTDARGIARPTSNPDVGAYQTLGATTNNPGATTVGAGIRVPNTGLGGGSSTSLINELAIFGSLIALLSVALVLRKRII